MVECNRIGSTKDSHSVTGARTTNLSVEKLMLTPLSYRANKIGVSQFYCKIKRPEEEVEATQSEHHNPTKAEEYLKIYSLHSNSYTDMCTLTSTNIYH